MPRPKARSSKSKPVKISAELAKRVTPKKIRAAAEKVVPIVRSTAWKGLEYAIAAAFKAAGFKKAKRVMKNEQILAASQHKELPDVNIPEAPFLQIDGKYSVSAWDKVERLFLECRAKYELAPTDRFAMVTQRAGSKVRIAHITLEWLAELCAKAYLGGKSSDCWVCPQCKSEDLLTQPIGMCQELTRCNVCTLEFCTTLNARPKS